MRILALDTSTEACSVALLLDGRVRALGPPDEVLVDDSLREWFGIRVHRGRTAEGPYVVPVGTVASDRQPPN